MANADMVDESGRYAPVDSYVDYEGVVIRRYLENRLPRWRKSYDQGGPAAALALTEAFSTQAVLNDYVEEGYGEFLAWAFEETDLAEQLSSFLFPAEGKRPSLLGEPATQQRPDLAWTPGDRQRLPDFVQSLADKGTAPNIESHFASKLDADRWKARTETLMEELAHYIRWVHHQVEQDGWQPVSLLRDALLIHLGLVWLGREDAKVLLLNRKFADAFGAPEEVYVKLLIETLYRDLADRNPPGDLEAMRQRFTEGALRPGLIPPGFIDACQHHLEALHLHAPPCWVESGVNGTFPLWLSAMSGNRGGMLLYNTVPWMYHYYEDITFRRDYQLLRDIETIVAHDVLFQVDLADPFANPMQVVVSADPKVQDLAAFEVVTLRRLLS